MRNLKLLLASMLVAVAAASAQGGPRCSSLIHICDTKVLISQFYCCADGVSGGGTSGTCSGYVCQNYTCTTEA